MVSKFNIVITVFKTCGRRISILNTKYYESPFEKLRLQKNGIIITNLSKIVYYVHRIVCIGAYSILCDFGAFTSFSAYTRIKSEKVEIAVIIAHLT